MDEGLVLEEAQMFPTAPPRIVNRLVRPAAGRAGEPAAGPERDLEVDLPGGRIEGYIIDIPRRLEPQCRREQALLRSHATPHVRERPEANRTRRAGQHGPARPPLRWLRSPRRTRLPGAQHVGSRQPAPAPSPHTDREGTDALPLGHTPTTRKYLLAGSDRIKSRAAEKWRPAEPRRHLVASCLRPVLRDGKDAPSGPRAWRRKARCPPLP